MNRQDLIKEYFNLGEKLENLNIKNFKNHCYWRMANDSSIGDKWNKHIKRPFIKNASHRQLQRSCKHLKNMFDNVKNIEIYNKKSLNYRNL